MSRNYDSTEVGVVYDRAHRIIIHYPESGTELLPWATIEQSEAVKLADGTVRRLDNLPSLQRSFNLTDDGNLPIPLVDPVTGAQIVGPNGPMFTTLNQVMLGILAVVRQEQVRVV